MIGSVDQQLQTDDSPTSSMSVSPATSDVGSPTAMATNIKCVTDSSIVPSFDEIASQLKEDKISISGDLGHGSKIGLANDSDKRLRRSSYSSNGSYRGLNARSRQELDRADLDLDWRSASRLRNSSGSSEENNKSVVYDDKMTLIKLHRADRDLNWRNHEDPPLVSTTSSSPSEQDNWRLKKARNYAESGLGRAKGYIFI